MKNISLLPLAIALFSLLIVLEAWQSNAFLRMMNQTSAANPEVLRKLSELENGLANGNITVQPPGRTKIVRTSVTILLARMREDSTQYAPYVELTQLFLTTALTVFAVQITLAIAVPVWQHRRRRGSPPQSSAPDSAAV